MNDFVVDLDVNTLERFAPKNRVKRRDVEDIQLLPNVTRKNKISYVIAPMWNSDIPPYNLARIVALSRNSGFETNVFDFNIETKFYMKEKDPEFESLWRSNAFNSWEIQNYHKKVHPFIVDYLDECVNKVLNTSPNIVGLSLYATNYWPSEYLAREIRKKNPNITIIVGGPQLQDTNFLNWRFNKVIEDKLFDYYFIGESEQNILHFLDDWENGKKPKEPKVGAWYGKKRLNLDSFPFPDYTDFDLTKYNTPLATVSEFTRGCVARCNYCSEVWFWKFRDRDSARVVEELEYQYDTYGHEFVMFADSLINGNIPEFKRFCELMKELRLTKRKDIRWTSQARADKRMDDDFYALMKEAGCENLKYGFESGSQNVLNLINKKRTVEEANANIASAYKAGITSSCLWLIGVPGELYQDCAHSYNFLWNNKYGYYSISIGSGLWDNIGTAYDDRERFNMSDREMHWLGAWWSLDKKNTRLHRFIRVKLTHILIDICNDNQQNGDWIENDWQIGDTKDHYVLGYESHNVKHHVEYEWDFDYNIIEYENDFDESVMNEVWPFLRFLWRVLGEYSIKIEFDPKLDKKDFSYICADELWDFTATIFFSISPAGNWFCKCIYKFEDKAKRMPATGKKQDDYIDYDSSFEHEFKGTGIW